MIEGVLGTTKKGADNLIYEITGNSGLYQIPKKCILRNCSSP